MLLSSSLHPHSLHWAVEYGGGAVVRLAILCFLASLSLVRLHSIVCVPMHSLHIISLQCVHVASFAPHESHLVSPHSQHSASFVVVAVHLQMLLFPCLPWML